MYCPCGLFNGWISGEVVITVGRTLTALGEDQELDNKSNFHVSLYTA